MSEIHRTIYGSGQPLVMLHGWSMHSGVWGRFAEILAENFQVICLDLPGHGRSADLEPFTTERVGETLLSAVDENSFHLLGWSLGGTLALEMARRAPERVASLTLLAANPRFVGTDDWPGVDASVLKAFAANLSIDSRSTLQRFLALQVNGLAGARELARQLKRMLAECPVPSSEALYGGLDILANCDAVADLKNLKCPLNVFLGDRDELVPWQSGDYIGSLRPDARINVLAGAGHAPFLTHGEEIANALAEGL